MVKPRSKTGTNVKFPFVFEKNGRTGRIKKWSDNKFGTYFRFAAKPMRNSFLTFDRALQHLDSEFSKLDTNRANAISLNPLNSDVKNYSELEQLLREQANGATLREAVTFFLAHQQHKKFEPRSFTKCAEVFTEHQKRNNISPIQIKTLEKHFRRFKKEFGARLIHEITALEIADWLITRKDEKSGKSWSAKTRIGNLGSLVSLSLFAKDTLRAIPDIGKTEFQKVRRPKKDERNEVEIYSVEEIRLLLLTAFDHDLDLIPALVTGAFEGLRPAEFHAEGARRRPLTWESFIWNDQNLHITGQKIRSKANRDIPLHPVTLAWLMPFAELTGPIWKHKQAYTKKMIALRQKTGVKSVYDGLRHSYASYRIRHLRGNLPELAQEMGNSPKEIIDSYKRNVTDALADEWFGIMPPSGYTEKIKAFLALSKTR